MGRLGRNSVSQTIALTSSLGSFAQDPAKDGWMGVGHVSFLPKMDGWSGAHELPLLAEKWLTIDHC